MGGILTSDSVDTPAHKKRKLMEDNISMDNNNKNVYRYKPKDLAQNYQGLKEDAEYFVTRPVGPANSQRSSGTTTKKSPLIVAATQLTGAGAPDSDVMDYCRRAERAIALAVMQHDANLVLLPELWSGPYFCQSQEAVLQSLADPIDAQRNILLQRMQRVAKHYQVVLPISLYERCHNVLYNSVVVIDGDGTNLGTYRKSHIPDGPGYQEKFYFSPGDSAGMGVFDSQTLGLRLGVAICWDQWFPETARLLALQGCEVLLYPTAIGSEPQDPTLNSAAHWQRVMQGHAAANMVPVVASNRFGTEILLRDDGDNSAEDAEMEEDFEELVQKKRRQLKARPEYSNIMEQCGQVLRTVREQDLLSGAYFIEPIDPVALGIPTYHQVISEPMDLKTVATRLKQDEIEGPEEFARLVRLCFENGMQFNVDPAHAVHQAARKLLILFNQHFREVERQVAAIRSEIQKQEDAAKAQRLAASEKQRIHFYGKSFITDATGAIVAECADNDTPEMPVSVVAATVHVEQNRRERLAWGLFRDRRPDLYGPLLTKDGRPGK